MFKNRFYRNIHARDLLDVFLVSAISSLLLVRFYLYLTGYPQVGSGSLHIAHMLYGGLLMMIALVISFSFIGIHSRQASALLGGIGFGVFIDELGKFITKDNNYFFQPTIGLIYALFVIMYLGFNFLSRSRKLTSREYQLNTLSELEEAIALEMDRSEKAKLYAMLDASDQSSKITAGLRRFVDSIELIPPDKPGRMAKILKKFDKTYESFWQQKSSNTLISILFAAEVIVLAGGILYTVYENTDDVISLFSGPATYGQELIVGQVISSLFAAGFVIYGLSYLKKSRVTAFEQFRRAALINVYLTQFFVFVRLQFEALPGLILNLVLLILISFVLAQESRLGKRYVRHRR